ncbi:MAG: helix-turn-helix domain-containing protein [Kurthia sp.]|nr:helix-turn-helix domain-containing protein [Candidatus Kurthia equi]
MSNNSTISSLTTGLQIIELISNANRSMKFTEIQEQTGITKSNLYKYLNTLTLAGVVYRDPRQGDYSLGYQLLKYGSKLVNSDEIMNRLLQYLKEINKLTSMTTLLASWINDRPVITQIANSNAGLNIGASISTELPPLSSVGKIFVAFKEDESVAQWQKEQLSTIQYKELEHELNQIKSEHFAYAKEPLVRHVSSISFPILNHENKIMGAVGVVGFTEDIPSQINSEFVQNILPIIKEMSAIFGYNK